jgi:ribonucleotide monophosphatase NagD (HAD superfamily)
LNALSNIRGILCDVVGKLTFKGSPIPGTIETLSTLRAAGKKLLFLTNMDSKVPATVYRRLRDQGFSVEEQEIFTPIIALQTFLQTHREKNIFLVSSKEVEEAFNEFKLVSNHDVPDYVVVADFRDEWDVAS